MDISVAKKASTIDSCTPSGNVCLLSVNLKNTSYGNNIEYMLSTTYLLLVRVGVRFEGTCQHFNAVYEGLVWVSKKMKMRRKQYTYPFNLL